MLHGGRLMLTSKEYEPINPDFLIMLHTDLIDQAFHVPQATESGHEIAVPITALSDITCSRAIDVELRVLKYILQ